MKAVFLFGGLSLVCAGHVSADDKALKDPTTRETKAVVSTTAWSNGDKTAVVRDPVYRHPLMIIEKTSFGTVYRDPVTRQIVSTSR